MPYYRRLPSGLWQATVRKPDGTRDTETDKLKSVVKEWALKEEARYRSGDRRDPRAGEIKLGEWQERVTQARSLEAATVDKIASIWRTHCDSEWAKWPMNSVTRMEAQEWVNRLKLAKRARHKGRDVDSATKEVPAISAATVHEIVNVMTKLYQLAIDEDPPIVTANPFARLDLPKIEPRPVEFYEHDEAALLYAALEDLHGGLKWRTLVELGMDVGLRPGENYGLHARRVDWPRGLVHVIDVMTRYGLREHPKSRKSYRTVPIPPATLMAMSKLVADRDVFADCTCPRILPNGERVPGNGPCPGLVFPAPEGGPIDDGNFRDRIWNPAVKKAGIRRLPPKIMRHTAASWLVQDGVPLYDVQALLGHESFATTQRYAHLAPDAHDKVIGSWTRRTETRDSDARVTHGRKEARPS